jgi:hypothetical protein
MVEPIIKDFDKLITQKRIAILAGREFDVSKIPTRFALEQAAFIDSLSTLKNEQKAFAKALEIAAKICNSSKPFGFFASLFKKRITVKWLIKNTNIEQLIAFINFILEPLNKPGPEKKN